MKFIGHTDVGQVRSGNEDAFAFDESRCIGVLADGMGGLNAGEVASQLAVEAFLGALQQAPDATAQYCDQHSMTRALQQANTQVYQLSKRNPALRNMGTTLVACGVDAQGRWVVGHVGDSRAYLLRGGELLPVTKDHSVVQELLDQGLLSEAEAAVAANRHIITRAVGLEPSIVPDVRLLGRQTGDLMMLCSDGLSDMVGREQLQALLVDPESPSTLAQRLVAAANRAGGNDNITVLLLAD